MKPFILCLIALQLSFAILSTTADQRLPDPFIVACAIAGSAIPFVIWLRLSLSQRASNWFHPVVIFSLSYFLVFFQIPLQEAFDLGNLQVSVAAPEMINHGALYATCGYLSFLIGWCCLDLRNLNIAASPLNRVNQRTSLLDASTALQILLIVATIAFATFAGLAGPTFYRDFLYDGGLSWGAGTSYAYAIWFPLNFLLIALDGCRAARLSHSLLGYAQRIGPGVKVYLAIVTLPFLIAGDRGMVLAIAFALLTPYVCLSGPFRLGHGIASFAVLATYTAAARLWRTRDSSTSLNDRLGNVLSSFGDSDLLLAVDPTSELAQSYYVFNATLHLFPLEQPHTSGKFLISSLVSTVPFLERFLGSRASANSATFMTDYLNQGDMSSGVGTACLNAPFMDFGLAGILVVMLAFGYFVRIVFNSITTRVNHQVLYVALAGYMSFQFLKIPRSDAFFMLQNLFWIALGYFAFIVPFQRQAPLPRTSSSARQAAHLRA